MVTWVYDALQIPNYIHQTKWKCKQWEFYQLIHLLKVENEERLINGEPPRIL